MCMTFHYCIHTCTSKILRFHFRYAYLCEKKFSLSHFLLKRWFDEFILHAQTSLDLWTVFFNGPLFYKMLLISVQKSYTNNILFPIKSTHLTNISTNSYAESVTVSVCMSDFFLLPNHFRNQKMNSTKLSKTVLCWYLTQSIWPKVAKKFPKKAKKFIKSL